MASRNLVSVIIFFTSFAIIYGNILSKISDVTSDLSLSKVSSSDFNFTNVKSDLASDFSLFNVSDLVSGLSLDEALEKFIKIVANASIENSSGSDRYKNTSDLIKDCGFTPEEYIITTGSGYLLRVFRIPSDGSPTLLIHGIFGSSEAFLGLQNSSLACKLAAAGHDVWLMDCRGNCYSRNHTSLSPSDPKFWNFSYHEMGVEDVPVVIDFILDKTGYKKVAIIGHSQGTTVTYICLSLNTDYNNKVSIVISMGPESWTCNMFNPFVQAAAKKWKDLSVGSDLLGIKEVVPRNALSKFIVREIFSATLITATILEFCLFFFFGFSFTQIDYVNKQGQLGHLPCGSSIYQVLHYLQGIDTCTFRQYDYGEEKNMKMYNSSEPPAYPVKNITAKMAFFQSQNDWLSSYEDLCTLKSQLVNVVGTHLVGADMNHAGYIWAKDADTRIYKTILNYIETENV